MQYRKLGGSSVTVSAIAFGGWPVMGIERGYVNERDAVESIEAALSAGVTTFDTAPVYGYGKGEEIMGTVLKGRRDSVQILTKFGLRWDCEEGVHFYDIKEPGGVYKLYRNARSESILKECEASLRRLETDYIDLYQCHWPDDSTPIEETMDALNQLVRQGKVRAIGVSNFNVEQISKAHQIAPIASNQPPYSMVRREIEKDVLPFCVDHNIATVVYSPLQRGLLTGRIRADQEFAEGDTRRVRPEFRPEFILYVNRFLDQIRPIAQKHNLTLGQLALNWTAHRPGITSVLVGARNAEQARENSRALDSTLSAQEMETITSLVEQLDLIPAKT